MQVKPSAGAVLLLGALVALILGRIACSRHETALVRRDAPIAQTTRRLLRCLLGRDAQRVVDGPGAAVAPTSETAPANAAITERLRRIAGADQGPDWPARCIPLARAVEHGATGTRGGAPFVARALEGVLDAARRDRSLWIQSVERGDVGRLLATLIADVRRNSSGAEAGWTSGLPPAASDLAPVQYEREPAVNAIATNVDYAVLAMPDLVLYQSANDRFLHAIAYDGRDRETSNRVVGRGAPVREASRDGAVRVADDDGDAIFLPAGEPAQLVTFPAAIRTGLERVDDWHVAATEAHVFLLTLDGGQARVRVARRSGVPAWDRPAATLGSAESLVDAVVIPRRGEDAVDVIGVRRRARGVALEAWRVDATTGTSGAGTPVSLDEWPAFDPQPDTCASGAVRYVALRSETSVDVVRLSALQASRLAVPARTLDGRSVTGGRWELSCDANRAIVWTEGPTGGATVAVFDFDANRAAPLPPPPIALESEVRIDGVALVPNGVLVAATNSGGTRVWRTTDGVLWSAMGLLAWNRGEGSARIEAFSALGDRVAALASADRGNRRIVTRFASRNGGRDFAEE